MKCLLSLSRDWLMIKTITCSSSLKPDEQTSSVVPTERSKRPPSGVCDADWQFDQFGHLSIQISMESVQTQSAHVVCVYQSGAGGAKPQAEVLLSWFVLFFIPLGYIKMYNKQTFMLRVTVRPSVCLSVCLLQWSLILLQIKTLGGPETFNCFVFINPEWSSDV